MPWRNNNPRPAYRGRFAPSPSGPLHFGSLMTALGSYLDARHHQGEWQIRIEDIDPPREVPGASDDILRTLERFGLTWDGAVSYQSQRHDFYRARLAEIHADNRSYACDCNRKSIMASGGLYQGNCRNNSDVGDSHSIRFVNERGIDTFVDRLQQQVQVASDFAGEDFILRRKDGHFAYQLVVVLDDIEQGITDIVRGSDLLEVTLRQLTLFHYFNHPPCRYLHLPLAVGDDGRKLSKQNQAQALDSGDPRPQLIQALRFLRQPLPEGAQDLNLEQLLAHAARHWHLDPIPLGKLPAISV